MDLIEEIENLSFRRFFVLLSGLSPDSAYLNILEGEKEEPVELSKGQSNALINRFF